MNIKDCINYLTSKLPFIDDNDNDNDSDNGNCKDTDDDIENKMIRYILKAWTIRVLSTAIKGVQ